ncbi:BrnT family toxin [Thiorhodococcus mannitoliphagus]|uniref:BrnT family toxin n=1 Tax=Thiorhodococcus mannitoliphagus TaxID=329406 RepID=A0A6P1E347_9GAMM|nr:BrnT family toxin [Thiorhodococcus mannitoliphagus]NEX22912.1 BrnT family toxin [Thiorhodococcus mannitoliphagus]
MITWDETKRHGNLAKHGLDFADAETIFDGPMLTIEDASEGYWEQRLKTLGILGGRVVVLVWTEGDAGPHLISLRYGDKRETKDFFSYFHS